MSPPTMKRSKKKGFSLLEVIAAVVILAVVAAATVATVAPMRAKSEDKLADQDVASLNAMSQTYYLEMGYYPPNIAYLVREGYISNADQAAITRYNKLRQYPYDRSTGTFSKPTN
ncbi:MAG: prepilin-type N-terminal cleavage/methylation domain-containing protein [Planctomycetota bacterium]